jgi:hypothetical protein
MCAAPRRDGRRRGSPRRFRARLADDRHLDLAGVFELILDLTRDLV